jgi:hypothetical protein
VVVEDVAFQIICEVLDPKVVRQAIDRVRVEGRGLEKRRRGLEAQVATTKEAIESASEFLIENQSALRGSGLSAEDRNTKAALVAHWTERLDRLQFKALQLQKDLQSTSLEEADFAVAAEADLADIKALASDLPRLLREARKTPAALRRLVDELVTQVRAQRLGEGVYEVEVEFPAGVKVRRVFFWGPIRCTQPERVWAHHRLNETRDAHMVSSELNNLCLHRRSAVWTEVRVQGAALIHEHFEPLSAREGVHQCPEALAELTATNTGEVLRTILADALGPACWRDGRIQVCPTESELAKQFPEYARRQISNRTGWPGEDLVSIPELRREQPALGQRVYFRVYHGRTAGKQDASGRMWVRRSEVEQLLNDYSEERVGSQHGVSLKDAVRELGRPDLDPADFVSVADLACDLQSRFHMPVRGDIDRAVKLGRVPMVRAHGTTREGRNYPHLIHIHVPRDIRVTNDRKKVRRWLDQITRPLDPPPLTARRKRKRVP